MLMRISHLYRFVKLFMEVPLEDANMKLASVVSDVMGTSAQLMLHALVEGEMTPTTMAQFARGRMRGKREQLEQALTGHFQSHHRFLITEHLTHIDNLEEGIDRLSTEIAEWLLPYEKLLLRLETIPGIKRRLAEIILAEIGPEMRRFPSAQHLASWAGMCPGNHESAGKRLSGKTRKGSQWLRTALVEAAHAASHCKECISVGSLSSYCCSSWEEASGGSPGTYSPDYYLPFAFQRKGL